MKLKTIKLMSAEIIHMYTVLTYKFYLFYLFMSLENENILGGE